MMMMLALKIPYRTGTLIHMILTNVFQAETRNSNQQTQNIWIAWSCRGDMR